MGEHCKKTFTARLLLYVYVGYPHQPPPKKKNSPDLHQSQEWSLAKVGWTCPPHPVHPVVTPLCNNYFFTSYIYLVLPQVICN